MTEKLAKGTELCPACGVRVRPALRKVPCPETEDCKARVIAQGYHARDWGEAFNVTQGKIIEEAGVPVEWALAGVHVEQQDLGKRGRHGEVIYQDVRVRHEVPFVPMAALRAVAAITKVQMQKHLRRRAIQEFTENPEALATLDSFKRLRGTITAGHVWQVLNALAKGAPDAQVLQHGGSDPDGLPDDPGTESDADPPVAAGR